MAGKPQPLTGISRDDTVKALTTAEKKPQSAKAQKKRAAPKGRPTDCTKEMVKAMAEAISSGLSVERACCRCGISTETYAIWRRRGKAGEEPFLNFLQAMERAKAVREEEWLADIRAAAKEDAKGHRQWQAAAWLLERTNAADWARPAQRVIVETVADPEASTATKEQLIAAALKAAQSERAKRG